MAVTHPLLDAPGIAAHNDRYLSLAKGKFNWQVTACLTLLLAMILAVALAYQYGQRKEYAYVVEIDELGVARYVRELPTQDIHTPYVIQAQVAQFIKDIRTVTTDRVAFTQQLNASYATCLKNVRQYIKIYYDEVKPLELIDKGVSIFPQKIDVAPLSATQYRAHWVEQRVQHGGVVEEAWWEATVGVELTHPADLTQEQRQRNPLGVWISYISWLKS